MYLSVPRMNVGISSNVRQVASNKRGKTFAELWRALNRAYEKNERSLERAYSNVPRINAAYNDELGSETVLKVIFTNVPIDRASKLDAVLEAATGSKIFYAVFTLVPRFSAVDRDDSAWINESMYFRRSTEDSLKRTLYGSSSTGTIPNRSDSEARKNGSSFGSFDDWYGRMNEIESESLFESMRVSEDDDGSESEDDESMGIIQFIVD